MMQADLAKVGINAKLVSYEWGEYRKRLQAGEHQMGLLGWTGDNGDPDNFFFLRGCDAEGKPAARTSPKWCNKEFNDMLFTGEEAVGPGRAHQALRADAGDRQTNRCA